MPEEGTIERAAELAARQSYGRLVAYLGRGWRDLAAVEDALGDAFAQALERWPETGVPSNPDAWLLVAARNRLLDGARSAKVRRDAVASLLVTIPDTEGEASMLPDKRLELMFVCAHPAIDPAMHTPLMLQTVLGLSAERIASSFLVSPDAMGRRLGRAKTRIRDIGIGFEVPGLDELPQRMAGVLEAIYAAYGQGWDGIASDDASRRGLSQEAIWLARALVAVAPGNAEALGLLALMLFCEARADARRVAGRYVPFADQHTSRWDMAAIEAAEAALAAAGRLRSPGRFQLEAAIQSAMVQGRLQDQDMRVPLVSLHTALVSFAPTIANLVGHAAAVAELDGPVTGLLVLDGLPVARTDAYQPYWALRAHLLQRLGASPVETRAAFDRAIGLCEDQAVRTYLSDRQASASEL